MEGNRALRELPIGVQDFVAIRRDNLLYVDKTARLQELVSNGRRYFLSRPRRFGKSLTLSTLDAMFSGRAELFDGLAAEEWVKEQAKHPSPVLRLDMSGLDSPSSSAELRSALIEELDDFAEEHGLTLRTEESCGRTLKNVIRELYKSDGPVVVLVDEYDKPILDNIGNLERANAAREVLRSFYTTLKSCDEYLRFVMLTGISKFSRAGVFSAMNNLEDISMDQQNGDIVGYTQDELEENFTGWLDSAAGRMALEGRELLQKMRDYYDGFCFDGRTKVYNPFSVMQCLKKAEFSNYWYASGSPSFIANYMKQHAIQSPEKYRHIEVSSDFVDAQEIECARPESFLYQSGYLTIEKKEGQNLLLDYPNREVLDSLSRMYLDHVYHVESYGALGSQIWKALKAGDIAKTVELYNVALSGIPYEDYDRQEALYPQGTGCPTAAHGGARMPPADWQGESWYRALFLMLLRGAGITASGELHTNRGRPDVVVLFPGQVIVLEFKYAKKSSDVASRRREGERQLSEKNYARPFDAEGRQITTAVIVIDGEKREAVL